MAYNPWITGKKFLTGLGLAFVPVALLYSINFFEGETFPPEYAWVPLIIIPTLHALSNWWKHRGD